MAMITCEGINECRRLYALRTIHVKDQTFNDCIFNHFWISGNDSIIIKWEHTGIFFKKILDDQSLSITFCVAFQPCVIMILLKWIY